MARTVLSFYAVPCSSPSELFLSAIQMRTLMHGSLTARALVTREAESALALGQTVEVTCPLPAVPA